MEDSPQDEEETEKIRLCGDAQQCLSATTKLKSKLMFSINFDCEMSHQYHFVSQLLFHLDSWRS